MTFDEGFMKIRMIALAGVAALLFAGPAQASDATGWYLGIAGGWDRLNNIDLKATTGGVTIDNRLKTDNSFLVTGAFGYRFRSHFRLEFEAGYTPHTFKDADLGGTIYGGNARIASALGNIVYDIPLSDRFDLSIGGGAGMGRGDIDVHSGAIDLAEGGHTGFMWQGLVGASYSLTHNVDLTLDWRYRSLMLNKSYPTSFIRSTVKVGNPNEQAVMLGLRWYLESEPPPPPPPPAPPPAPPPPPPPPVKTFIVFFDFNKSNLTAEALAVVQQAVKVAQQSGAVRVLVTGHTDTVGSDSYNQGLSVRRAESVKDEMTREGMDGSSISIEGKSFHDPLVPTGPGVREPQNRRAVIDLGS
jgi:outer membrane protein OmpA-like peptidoglycan-associated protein